MDKPPPEAVSAITHPAPAPAQGAAGAVAAAGRGATGNSSPPKSTRRRKVDRREAKTYDIARGRFGFGFTLSGQHPCILSSVIPDSPAETSGLKSGDALVTVNGKNVTRLAHGEVVRLISQSQGLIRVQVSETFCSDSSSEEEDGEVNRYRPAVRRLARRDAPLREIDSNKYSKIGTDYDNIDKFSAMVARERLQDCRPVTLRRRDTDAEHFSDGEHQTYERRHSRHVRSSSIDSSFITELSPRSQIPPMDQRRPLPSPPGGEKSLHRRVDLGASEELTLGQNSSTVHQDRGRRIEGRPRGGVPDQHIGDAVAGGVLLQAVVGYLGTIELSLDSNAGLQDIRNCIRRLRVEKKVHTLVLFVIYNDKIVLINHHATHLAEFQADKISFCGVCEDDKRFFGIVTKQVELGDSCSCHVFMVEPTSSQHERIQRARVFNIQPTFNQQGECKEFPVDADPILSVIFSIKHVNNQNLHQDNVSVSSLSNSDSGIVYREDSNNQAQQVRDSAIIHEGGGQVERDGAGGQDDRPGDQIQKLGVRAMPDPAIANSVTPETSFNSDRLECLQSAEHIRLSMQKYLQDKHEHLKRSSQQLADRHISSLSSQDSGLQNVQRLIKQKFEERAAQQDRGASSGALRRSAAKPDRTAGTPTPSVSERSYARSLEELPTTSGCEPEVGVGSADDDDVGPPSLPLMSSLPLARFLYSSESNLSQVEDAARSAGIADWVRSGQSGQDAARSAGIADWVNLHSRPNPLSQPRWQEGLYGGVLKPSDQYPVDPLVKLRPRSRVSNKSHRSSMFEFSDYDAFSAPNSAASTLSRRLDSGPQSAASTLSRKRRQEPSIEEEADNENLERTSVPGDLEARRPQTNFVSSPAAGGPAKPRARRKSDSESIRETTFSNEEKANAREKDIGRVGGWAADFDKLLADAAGIHTFAEFQKKEFSHENIYFWCFCQRYSKIKDPLERLKVAKEIFSSHMSECATDPVNVDSVARSTTQDRLQECNEDNPPGADLFETAQKQIYNLMKFDSFSRFLKSDLYKESLLADMGGTPLPINGQDQCDPQLAVDLLPPLNTSGEAGKAVKKDEGGRRKSILPWGRNRSKSKDRAEQDRISLFKGIRLPGQGGSGRLSSSHDKSSGGDATRSSGGDAPPGPKCDPLDTGGGAVSEGSGGVNEAENSSLTRFILPDKATTVVPPSSGDTIRSTIAKLLEKRGLKFTSFDAFVVGSDKPLDLSEDAASLASAEVRVEARVLFSVELPNRKCIGVKAKQTKKVEDVLRPILQQYGWNLDLMTVSVERPGTSGRSGIEYTASVTSIDNCRLTITSHQDLQTKVLEDIIKRNSDSESTKSESRPVSRNSTGHTTIFRRQLSAELGSMKRNSEEMMPPPVKIPSIRRRHPVTSPSFREQENQLYEGLKRMTQGRLDDQRGTEINMELPDFLKKEGASQEIGRGDGMRDSLRRESNILSRLSGGGDFDLEGWDKDQAKRYLDYIDSTFTKDGCVNPATDQADDVFITPDPDESMNFSESRLSLGFRNESRMSHGAPHNSSGGVHNTSGSSMNATNSKSLDFGSADGLSLPARPSLGFTINYESVLNRQSRSSIKDYEFLRNNPELDRRISVENNPELGRRISIENPDHSRRISIENQEVNRRISIDNPEHGRRVSVENNVDIHRRRRSLENMDPRLSGLPLLPPQETGNPDVTDSNARKNNPDYEPVQFGQSLPHPGAPHLQRKSPLHQPPGLPMQGGGGPPPPRPPPPLYKPVPQYPNQMTSRRPHSASGQPAPPHPQHYLPRHQYSPAAPHHPPAAPHHPPAALRHPPLPPPPPPPNKPASNWFPGPRPLLHPQQQQQRAPPPLPPKPVRLAHNIAGDGVGGIPIVRTQNGGVHLSLPGEKGYSVSFV